MRLSLKSIVPVEYDAARFRESFGLVESQVNLLAEGRLRGRHFTSTSIPTTGDFAVGDMVWKTTPVEAGAGGSKYVILGWVCTVSGSPGTLLEMRVLTGN